MKNMGAKKVFYAGHLRAFKHVGAHPQFEHINCAPPGYEFVFGNHLDFKTIVPLLKSLVHLSRDSLANGATLNDFVKFVRSRSISTQFSLPSGMSLVFLPSMPFILGQVPWVIEIEDTTTLFAPFPRIDGKRHDPRLFGTGGIYDSGFLPMIKALLESTNCRGIICHVRSTAKSVPVLFNNAQLADKIMYIPLGIQSRSQVKVPKKNDTITLLFTNSWHQASTGFYLRGGLDVLEAYSVVFSTHADVRLIIRSKLPEGLDHRYREIIERCNVQVIDQFLSGKDLHALYSSADIYVLPSARLHVVSILQAMAHGLASVVSDGWGIAEYVDHGRNGLIVPGRYGTCSWMDENGMLRENYQSLFSANPAVATGLVDALSMLIKNPDMRRNLAEAAVKDVATTYSIERWNLDLAKAFDKALM